MTPPQQPPHSPFPPRRPPERRRPVLDLLELDRRGDTRFLAPSPSEGWGRLYGGQVASQSLRAATLTVDQERLPHSLHSYFIRPGKPGTALELDVELTRDGRSFSTRSVTASQEGEPIFTMIASFHRPEDGENWQEPMSLAGVPGPDDITTEGGMFSSGWNVGFDMRPLTTEAFRPHPCWVKMVEPIEDDPLLHACALTYISDRAVVGSARAPGATFRMAGASLDHSVWFHRPVRVDQWLYFSVDPVINFGARGLARGTFHDTDGVLVASISQEALLRPTA
ncbi:MAG TPA: acyl-CoA thioesterase domain-containing protein [Acidimicrobiales bacterium]|nr:acyl-CoA thioesterase domain-containing protein [Acidimicrobiales bacterium]